MRMFTNLLRFMALAGVVATPALAQTDSRAGGDRGPAGAEGGAGEAGRTRTRSNTAMLWFREHDLLRALFRGLRPDSVRSSAVWAPAPASESARSTAGPDLLGGQLNFRASAQTSFRGDRKFDLELAAPKISSGRYFAEFYAVHHDYPRHATTTARGRIRRRPAAPISGSRTRPWTRPSVCVPAGT